jgi:hypothetical protein
LRRGRRGAFDSGRHRGRLAGSAAARAERRLRGLSVRGRLRARAGAGAQAAHGLPAAGKGSLPLTQTLETIAKTGNHTRKIDSRNGFFEKIEIPLFIFMPLFDNI